MQISNINRYLLNIYQFSESSDILSHGGFGVYALVFGLLILAYR